MAMSSFHFHFRRIGQIHSVAFVLVMLVGAIITYNGTKVRLWQHPSAAGLFGQRVHPITTTHFVPPPFPDRYRPIARTDDTGE